MPVRIIKSSKKDLDLEMWYPVCYCIVETDK